MSRNMLVMYHVGYFIKVIRNKFPKAKQTQQSIPIISCFHSALPLGLCRKAVYYGTTKKAKG